MPAWVSFPRVLIRRRGFPVYPRFGGSLAAKIGANNARHNGWSAILAWRTHVPASSATAIERLQRAGAIVMGKTNVPFLSGDLQTCNDVYGTTNNPWALECGPGGSSGGRAASVAPAGITSEGKPVGIQIIGPHLEDYTTIAVAGMFEEILGGFKPPKDW
ncbi:MAG: hypothetical protein H5U13_10520 [Parvibaculum sp.]|nr:hypothetical protein [Parvibaculum sp.]